jgi:uncharacterized protein YecT (DUF1311 family)
MKYLFLFPILFLSNQVFALDCEKAITTPDINECGRIELDKVEKELNLVYQRVLKMMDKISKEPSAENNSDLKKSFIDAQRLWVKFREADCQTTYTFWSGGTIRGAMYIGCMQARAKQRIKELQEYEKTY